MPIKYIGRTTNFQGKTLWEIVGNLKNFGVGRYVARSMFERYPEPSYMKILKVETLPNPESASLDNARKVRVWVEKTFRGQTSPKPVIIESASYKADYKLIPKDEELNYCKFEQKFSKEEKVLPRTCDFPPLMKELLLREAKKSGGKITEEPKLELAYKKGRESRYRAASEDEVPNISLLGLDLKKNLYKNV